MSCALVDLHNMTYTHRLSLNDRVMLIEHGTLSAVTMTVDRVLQQITKGLEVTNLHISKDGSIFAKSLNYDNWTYGGRFICTEPVLSNLYIYDRVKIESNYNILELNGVDWSVLNIVGYEPYVRYIYRLGDILVVRLGIRSIYQENAFRFGVLILNANTCDLLEADLYDRQNAICHLNGMYCAKLLMMGAF